MIALQEIITVTGGTLLSTGSEAVTGISTDTRSLRPGEIFIALRGENFDGHRFVADALYKGAAGVVLSSLPNGLAQSADARGKSIIKVADTLLALGAIATAHRRKFSLPLIAITGSVGKTATKEMLAHILSKRREVLRTPENYNNEIGVPLALLALTEHHQAAVIEMAMRGPDQIRYLAELAQPVVGVITNIGPSHLELLCDEESTARAKAELLEVMGPQGTAVLNADDRFFPLLRELAPGRVVTFGLQQPADYQTAEVSSADGLSADFVLHTGGVMIMAHLPVPGMHQVHNALAAVAAACQIGESASEAITALEDFSPAHGRLETVTTARGFTIIDDSYNASPASMEAALQVLARYPAERKLAVLGDMKELGPQEHEFHRQVGRQAADTGLSLLVTVGELAATIVEGAASNLASDRIMQVNSNDQAAEILLQHLRPGDVVLVKGSRVMAMEQIVERLKHA